MFTPAQLRHYPHPEMSPYNFQPQRNIFQAQHFVPKLTGFMSDSPSATALDVANTGAMNSIFASSIESLRMRARQHEALLGSTDTES